MKLKTYLKPILEITLINFIIYIIFYKVQPNPEIYFNLNPHPLLIVLMGFALFYGNFIGIIATLITIFIYITLFYLTYNDIILLFSDFKFFKYPLLFLWVSTIIGTIVDNYSNENKQLENDYNLILKNLKILGKNYKLSQKALNELKKQIINSETSIISLYEIATKLKKLNIEELYNESIAILSKYLKANTISLYIYDEKSGYFRLKIQKGISQIENKNSINIDEVPEYKPIIEKQEVLRYVDVQKENFPILSGPIIKNRKTIGIVNIENMEFNAISNYAHILFKVILDWINISFRNAEIFEVKVYDKYYESSSIMKYKHFKERLKSEKRRKEEYNLDYSLLIYKCDSDILKTSIKIKSVIRDLDIVSFNENHIYLLLPAVEKSIENIVKQKIYSRLDFDLKKMEVGG